MLNIFNQSWFVYILVCNDGTLYTGITHNLQKRFHRHQAGSGARYTARHGANQILYFQEYPNHKEAALRELEIKSLSHEDKLRIILHHILDITEIHKQLKSSPVVETSNQI
jgi:putative endonuclease